MNARAIQLVRRDALEAVQGRLDLLTQLKGKRLLITGGTGFLGTWLAELIASLNDDFGFGIEATLLARDTDGFTARLPHLATRRDLLLRRGDVRGLVELPREVSHVIHAAATPDNREHASRPVETMHVIAAGTAAVVSALERASGFERMLHVSSALVYGRQPEDLAALPEDHPGAPALGVGSAYAEAKRYAETYCAAARSQLKLPVVTARPFAFVGPYQSLDRPWAINNFLRDALQGKPVRVQGDGQTVRSYLYGADAAAWVLRILVAGDPGSAYNIGSPEALTLEKLAHLVSDKVSSRPEVHLRTAGSTRVPKTRLVPDVARAAGLGLSPGLPLEKALERTLEWHRLQ